MKKSETKNLVRILFLAIPVGIISGFGAIFFRYLIALFHNLFFSGGVTFSYNANLHFVSSLGNLVFLVPAIGGLLVGFLVMKFAPEAKGHGVPEVMEAVIEKRGRIRPVVAFVKSLASAICIGSGGSAGREGPIVQIGASFGSTLGQLFKLKPKDTITLVGCGAAGGIAATFNAPIGGVLFAVELILPSFSTKTFIPLVVSSTIATYISRLFLGLAPAFTLPHFELVSFWEFIFYSLLGSISGLIAISFIKLLYKSEDIFNKLRISNYLKPAIGGILIGTIGLFFYKISGHYYIFGVGYAFINDILTGANLPLLFCLGLVLFKLLATSLTIGSGGSGGIFAPSLFIGAATGASFGIFIHWLFPGITASPSAYALIGMASVVAGTTNATLTAIVMTFEMTRAYSIILPVMLGAVISDFIVANFCKESIYTQKLTRRGLKPPRERQFDVLSMLHVKKTMRKDISYVFSANPVSKASKIILSKGTHTIPVLDENKRPVGIVRYVDLFGLESTTKIEKVLLRKDITISARATLLDALMKMDKEKIEFLVVLENNEVAGVILRSDVTKRSLEKRESLL